MLVVPVRMSPPRSLPHSLPASPVLSAAPAVLVAATPALTLQSAASPTSHSHAHSYTAYYPHSTTLVATPAAVLNESPRPKGHQHRHYRYQPPHPTEVHERPQYCDRHAPASYKPPSAAADHQPHPPLMYTQPSSVVPYYQLVYDALSPAVTHYPAVTTSQPVCSCGPLETFTMAVPQPSLSPLHAPHLHRLNPTTPPLSLSPSGGSAFTPVQPIAVYPRSGIRIH